MENELEENTTIKQNEIRLPLSGGHRVSQDLGTCGVLKVGGGGEGALLVGRYVGERGSAEVKLGRVFGL